MRSRRRWSRAVPSWRAYRGRCGIGSACSTTPADEFALSVDGVGYPRLALQGSEMECMRAPEGRTYVVRLVGHESKAASAEAPDEIPRQHAQGSCGRAVIEVRR